MSDEPAVRAALQRRNLLRCCDGVNDVWQTNWRGDPAERFDVDLDELRVSLIERPAFHARAACRGMGTAAWFTGQGVDNSAARAICSTCPVVVECRAAGDLEEFGMWGNTTASQRVRERSQRREAA